MKSKVTTVVLMGMGLVIFCVGIGYKSVSFVLGAFWFKPFWVGVLTAFVAVVVGAFISAFSSHRFPRLWILWPALFGTPMFVFGMGAGFSNPNVRGIILWRTLAISFIAIPLAGGYIGRLTKLRNVSESDISDL